MKRISVIIAVFFFVFFSIVGFSSAGGFDDDVVVKFSSPVKISDLGKSLGSEKIKPREIYYEVGSISGGYTLSEGEDLEIATQEMLKRHISFLEAASDAMREEVKSMPTLLTAEKRSKKESKKLKKKFDDLLQEARKGNFSISGIRVIDVNDLSLMGGEVGIDSIAPVRKSKKNLENSNNDKVKAQSYSHESWAPYGGSTKVTQYQAYNTFYFNNTDKFSSTSTYEHETQIYNISFANYDKYWSSNLPRAYYDTPFLDELDNFTVGSAYADGIKKYTKYYTYIALKPGSVKSATVRIKGQRGHRSPSWCYSTWCVYPDSTTGTMLKFTAPMNGMSWQY